MNIDESDSINGQDPWRQLVILLTHITLLVASWFLIKQFQCSLLSIAGFKELAKDYSEKGYYIPLTLILWGFLWINIFLVLKRGWYSPKGNHAQASYNALWSKKLDNGGTSFIINQTGFGLAYLWQPPQGSEIEIDKEITMDCGETTISVKRISLKAELVITYRIWQRGLSRYLQNTVNISDGKPAVLEQIKASGNQFIEVAACKLGSTEEVRSKQTDLANEILPALVAEGQELGIEILAVRFKKCDYSVETQKELDKILEAQGIKDIALDMGFDDANRHRAFELAAVIAGKPGATSGRGITEIIMDPNTADAIKAAGPAAAALLMSMFRNNNSNKPKTP